MIRTILSQLKELTALWEKLLSGVLASDRILLKKIEILWTGLSQQWASFPAQAVLPHLKLFWNKSVKKARAAHMMCLWGMQRQSRIVAPLLSFPAELLETRAAQTWLLLATECPSKGKRCFDTIETACGKVSILTEFSEKVQVFPAYWNFCFDFQNALQKP